MMLAYKIVKCRHPQWRTDLGQVIIARDIQAMYSQLKDSELKVLKSTELLTLLWYVATLYILGTLLGINIMPWFEP